MKYMQAFPCHTNEKQLIVELPLLATYFPEQIKIEEERRDGGEDSNLKIKLTII